MSNYTEQVERYSILIEGGPSSNYFAWSPELPACVTTGESVDEVEREIRAAIASTSKASPRMAGRFRSPRAWAGTSSETARSCVAASSGRRFDQSRDRAGRNEKAASRPPFRKSLQISMELGGLEPPTSWVRSRRSPNGAIARGAQKCAARRSRPREAGALSRAGRGA